MRAKLNLIKKINNMRLNLNLILIISVLVSLGLYLAGDLNVYGLSIFGLLALAVFLIRKPKTVFGLLLIIVFSLPLISFYQEGRFLNYWGYAMMISAIIFSVAIYGQIKKKNDDKKGDNQKNY